MSNSEYEVYYRLYLSPRNEKICVITMQDFDERDYDDHRFVREKGSDYKLIFDEEHEAKKFAWDNIKLEFLDDSLLPDCSYREKNDSLYKD